MDNQVDKAITGIFVCDYIFIVLTIILIGAGAIKAAKYTRGFTFIVMYALITVILVWKVHWGTPWIYLGAAIVGILWIVVIGVLWNRFQLKENPFILQNNIASLLTFLAMTCYTVGVHLLYWKHGDKEEFDTPEIQDVDVEETTKVKPGTAAKPKTVQDIKLQEDTATQSSREILDIEPQVDTLKGEPLKHQVRGVISETDSKEEEKQEQLITPKKELQGTRIKKKKKDKPAMIPISSTPAKNILTDQDNKGLLRVVVIGFASPDESGDRYPLATMDVNLEEELGELNEITVSETLQEAMNSVEPSIYYTHPKTTMGYFVDQVFWRYINRFMKGANTSTMIDLKKDYHFLIKGRQYEPKKLQKEYQNHRMDDELFTTYYQSERNEVNVTILTNRPNIWTPTTICIPKVIFEGDEDLDPADEDKMTWKQQRRLAESEWNRKEAIAEENLAKIERGETENLVKFVGVAVTPTNRWRRAIGISGAKDEHCYFTLLNTKQTLPIIFDKLMRKLRRQVEAPKHWHAEIINQGQPLAEDSHLHLTSTGIYTRAKEFYSRADRPLHRGINEDNFLEMELDRRQRIQKNIWSTSLLTLIGEFEDQYVPEVLIRIEFFNNEREVNDSLKPPWSLAHAAGGGYRKTKEKKSDVNEPQEESKEDEGFWWKTQEEYEDWLRRHIESRRGPKGEPKEEEPSGSWWG